MKFKMEIKEKDLQKIEDKIKSIKYYIIFFIA